MAPGPMSAVAVGIGTRWRYAGAVMAVGHGIVEFPLMAALVLGAGPLFKIAGVGNAIGLFGGLVLVWLGVRAFRSLSEADLNTRQSARSPLIAGMLLSVGNPYFLIWWATVGLTLLDKAEKFGRTGVFAFAVAHWMCDLVWLTVLSILAFAGANVMGRRFQQGVLIICGLMLVGFGIWFIADSVPLPGA
jgi:threonine/homoserine/homoserine lactone efflux protein